MTQNKHKIPVAGYNPRTKELFFSWRSDESGSSDAPDRTLVYNLEFGHASYMDHGFTAMTNYQSYNQMSLRDFLVETIVDSHDVSICDCDDSVNDIMQGDPYVVGRTANTTEFPSLVNATEDTSASTDANSLCGKLGNMRFEEFCDDGTEGSTFVMASSSDKCLKQYEEDYYKRDIYNGSSYTTSGYQSILESGALHFDTDDEKMLQRVTLEYSGTNSTAVTATMKFGKANQPDQLLSGINYTALSGTQVLDDQSAATNENIINNNINPDDKAYFNNITRGRYLGYQLKLTGDGPATVTRVTLSMRKAEK